MGGDSGPYWHWKQSPNLRSSVANYARSKLPYIPSTIVISMIKDPDTFPYSDQNETPPPQRLFIAPHIHVIGKENRTNFKYSLLYSSDIRELTLPRIQSTSYTINKEITPLNCHRSQCHWPRTLRCRGLIWMALCIDSSPYMTPFPVSQTDIKMVYSIVHICICTSPKKKAKIKKRNS